MGALLARVCLILLPALATLADDGPLPARADRELLRRVLSEHRIETTPPSPGVAQYLGDLTLTLARAVAGLLSGIFGTGAALAAWLAWVILAVAAGLLIFLAARWLVRRRRGRGPSGSAPITVLPPATSGADRGPDDRAMELRRHLEEGDVAAALEALWWWLATRLIEGRAEPSWTSRELLGRAGRWDLLALVRRLDRMIYGAVPPRRDEVREIFGEFEASLGETPG